MKIRNKALLFSTAVLAASAVYGHHRFESSRYPPAIEVLPGISVYGNERVTDLSFSARTMSETLTERSVKLASPGMPHGYLKVVYGTGSITDVLLVSEAESATRMLDHPVKSETLQLVVSPYSGFLVKGHSDSFDLIDDALKSYLGISEIFRIPPPVQFDCKAPEKFEKPKVCAEPEKPPNVVDKRSKKSKKVVPAPQLPDDEKHGCELLDRMNAVPRSLLQLETCMLDNMQLRLAEDLAPAADLSYYLVSNPLKDDLASSQILIDDILTGHDTNPAKSHFWKGWDWVYGFAVLGALGYLISGFRRKIKSEDIGSDATEVPPRHDYQGTRRGVRTVPTEVVDMEGKREKLKKWYISEIDKLYERLAKVERLDECGTISEAFDVIEDKVRNTDPELFMQLQDVRHRFNVALDGRIEFLGGPKAPMF